MKSVGRKEDGFGIIVVVVLIGVLAGLGGASWAVYQHEKRNAIDGQAQAQQTDNDNEVVMIVGHRGGLCAASDNSATGCNSQDRLYMDGTFEKHTPVTPVEVERLRSLIAKTDFLKYKPKTFPRCPSYVDGTDEVLIFPREYPNKSFVLCELDIRATDTTINYIEDLIKAHQIH